MAPSKTKELLTEAGKWEESMREAILFKVEHGDTVTSSLNRQARWIEGQIDDLMRSQQEAYETASASKLLWNAPQEGKDLKEYQNQSRVQYQRHKMLAAYRSTGRLSRSENLDPTYIDYVLLPEWMALADRAREEQRRKIETTKPQQSKVVYVPTPLGRIWFLRTPRPQSKELTRFIHGSVHTDIVSKMEALEELEKLAAMEAKWELEIARREQQQSTSTPAATPNSVPRHTHREAEEKAITEWTAPIRSALMSLKLKKRSFERKTSSYVNIIVSRKRLKDIELLGKFKRNVAKWKEIDEQRAKKPYLWNIHSDVRKLI